MEESTAQRTTMKLVRAVTTVIVAITLLELVNTQRSISALEMIATACHINCTHRHTIITLVGPQAPHYTASSLDAM